MMQARRRSASEGVGFVGDRFDVGGGSAASRRMVRCWTSGRGDAARSSASSSAALSELVDQRQLGRRFADRRSAGCRQSACDGSVRRQRAALRRHANGSGNSAGASPAASAAASVATALRRLRRAWRPARSARPARYRRRCRRVAAPCGRCRRRLDAALLQRVAARLVEAGLGKIAKAEQRTRGVAGADQHAVAGKGRDRRHRCLRPGAAAVRPAASRGRAVAGRDQNAVAAVGEIEPRAAAGHQRAERRAEAAQPLQPGRAGRRAAGRRVAPPGGGADPRGRRSCRPAPRRWPRRTAVRRPDWPTESACRRSTTARPAGRSWHAPPAADRRRLATGIPHCSSQ